MGRIFKIVKNRDLLLILSIVLGLVAGNVAHWTEKGVIPILAVVMTLTTMGIPGNVFRSPWTLVWPVFLGLVMNYGVLGGVLLGLNALLIREEAFRAGFIIIIAVPPAIAVIPFTSLLNGDSPFSLIATIGCYLSALVLMPIITFSFLGEGFADRTKLLTIMIELILVPLIFSRLLRWSGLEKKIDPYKGAITNWSFFLVTYTIVGLNRNLFLNQPWEIAPVVLIALISTFLLGEGIEVIGRIFKVNSSRLISLILLGTHKNTGLAAGLALTLFGDKTALPAAVSTIFMIVYIIWLNLKGHRNQSPA